MSRDADPLRRRAGELTELLRLAVPVIGARVGIMAMGLTDSILVGRYSASELGFNALGWAPTAVMLTAANGLLVGVQVMTSRSVGEGRPELTGAVLRRGVVYALGIGLVSCAALYLFGPAFLRALGLEPALAAGAGRVVRVFCLSLPFYLVAVACTGFLEGLGRPTPGLIAMWSANVVNLFLNLWLIRGGHGVPAMGAVGSAWATFGARFTLMSALVGYVLLMPQARALGVFNKPERDRAREVEQRRIGYGAGASLFAESAAFSGMNVVAGWLGGLAVAGWAVVLNLTAFLFMVPLGLSAATGVLVGRAYGARDHAGVIRAGRLGFTVCVVISSLFVLVVWPCAGLVARVYATDPALIALGTHVVVLACLFFIPDALQVVAAMALRARADVLVPTIIHVSSYALVMLPLGWFLAHPAGMGLDGVVWSVIVASWLVAALLLGRFWMLARREL